MRAMRPASVLAPSASESADPNADPANGLAYGRTSGELSTPLRRSENFH